MNSLPHRVSEFAGKFPQGDNSLSRYIHSLDPEKVAQLSQASPEVAQIIERNIIGLLGGLPHEDFDVEITTSRDNLGRLLASATLGGYFLRNAEQRLDLETQLQAAVEDRHSETQN
ncbi:MAG: DUF760 domain-containing protein [Oscillatoria sp. PMC 1068.18]|nr:DUF760 domain-containing protein [Oscillatoria sp. PMC 1076.18]MEC4987810.1 DUF760 domain-containing protein [Oscillatoria sp. PMC 1068.18]